MDRRLSVLTISSLFPERVNPARGIFVERQVTHLLPYCDHMVVCPVRVFPPLRLWKHVIRPKRFSAEWRQWHTDLQHIPQQDTINGIEVHYPRYTSPPRQGFQGQWGYYAYPFVRGSLKKLAEQHQFDLIHAHYASPCGVIALLAARWLHIPIVLSIHGADVYYTVHENRLSKHIVRHVFDNVDAVLANSQWTFDRIIEHGGDPARTEIVYLGGNATDTTPEDNCAAIPSADDGRPLQLLSIGSLRETKGHAYVLHALRRLIDAGYRLNYTIVGDGDEHQRLLRLTRELNLMDFVRFVGACPHDQVWCYFRACDIFVLPSWIEGFGIVYIEAMWCKKPVIGCTTAGGPQDLAQLGDCIELVAPQSTESLVAALQRLLDDPQRRNKLADTGYQVVTEHFTWERNAQETFAVYERVLQGHTARKTEFLAETRFLSEQAHE